LTGKNSEIEILNASRLGSADYDFETVKLIKNWQSAIFEIKSNIDGKIYAGKRLQY
jgi:hypothetical protein